MPDWQHQSIVEAIEAAPEVAIELAVQVAPLLLPPHRKLEIGNVAVSETTR